MAVATPTPHSSFGSACGPDAARKTRSAAAPVPYVAGTRIRSTRDACLHRARASHLPAEARSAPGTHTCRRADEGGCMTRILVTRSSLVVRRPSDAERTDATRRARLVLWVDCPDLTSRHGRERERENPAGCRGTNHKGSPPGRPVHRIWKK